MIEGIIGKKIGMTQNFNDSGIAIPVTVIQAGPCVVIQKKTEKIDGYSVLQLGLANDNSTRKAIKTEIGHFKKSGISPVKVLKEFHFSDKEEINPGDQFFADIFKKGERVHIVGTSKGKGFAGVIKRWGFHGGRKTHGSMFHRHAGSTGCSADPSRVMKGKKMPGQMGNNRVTVKNLTVIEADKEKNLLVVKGAVPGANGGYLLIKKADFLAQSSGKSKKE